MDVISIVLALFGTIGQILYAPFLHYDMLWIIIPVYLNWIFTEFYQEKKGTSLGNAITNGFVALWVGIDWARTTFNFLAEKAIKKGISLNTKFFVAGMMVFYGLFIVVMGIRGKHAVAFLGRIREVTYFTIMLTPIFYGAVKPTWTVIISILVFFPVFYGIVEFINWLLPTPAIYDEDKPLQHASKDPNAPTDYYSPLSTEPLSQRYSEYPRFPR